MQAMSAWLWLASMLALLAFLLYRAVRIWLDAGRWGFRSASRLGWAMRGGLVPARYWWGARLEQLPAAERAALLTAETKALGLSGADSLRCPLCGAEIPHAWTLTAEGRPTVAAGPVCCPACDFRLDACRHCVHFLPGSPASTSVWVSWDLTFGRCRRYQEVQPVEQVCPPDMARRLRARSYDQLRALVVIVDSFVRLDRCRAYQPDRQRLRMGGVRWPDARRSALLRLQGAIAPSRGRQTCQTYLQEEDEG